MQQLQQLMDIVSNFIFHSNHYDANRVFVKFRESADPYSCHANSWFIWGTKYTFKGIPPPTICARLDRQVNALQLCRWQFSHKEVDSSRHLLRKYNSFMKKRPFWFSVRYLSLDHWKVLSGLPVSVNWLFFG